MKNKKRNRSEHKWRGQYERKREEYETHLYFIIFVMMVAVGLILFASLAVIMPG
ncbi:hypothetical protein [Klebsiella oxytoca]|uniref:hypothetical protein n=1 Tax=Klebsiella oxytoca TaxID=571 RepID=UPI0039C8D1DA